MLDAARNALGPVLAPRTIARLAAGCAGSLTTLDLSHNRLASLPPELGRLTKLRSLALAHNQLRAVPAALATCGELTKLALHANALDAAGLPSGLGWRRARDPELKEDDALALGIAADPDAFAEVRGQTAVCARGRRARAAAPTARAAAAR